MASYVGTGGSIADNGTTDFSLEDPMPDSVIVGDLNVHLDISHQQDADLDVYLIGPNGTRVELFTDVGGGGDNFSGTILDDEALTPITSGSAPFAGSYQPEGSLSDFDESDAQGTWTLEISDDRRRRSGSLNSWSIEVTPSIPSTPLIPTISFPDFTDPSGLALVGDASAPAGTENALRLTPAIGGQQGAAWYTAEKQFVAIDWETTFDFNLSENQDAPGGSDGFVFVVQNHDPSFLAGGGGTLGYNNLPNSLAVEFDTFQNGNVNDPSGSHISVHTNGTLPNSWDEALSLGSYNTPSIIDDAATHTARIRYTPGTLSVYLDNLSSPVLSVPVDLAEILDLDAGRAWVGFTATTGGGWQNHDILNWEYGLRDDTSTTIAIENAAVVEGNSGTTDVVFTVERLGDTSGTTTVNWSTADASATAGSDFLTTSGQVVFNSGETEKTVTVTVNGDTLEEGDEAFRVLLSDAVGAVIVDATAVGTIIGDDATISISDAVVVEGNAGNTISTTLPDGLIGGPTPSVGDAFGQSVASLGDLDGDGVEDIAVGAWNDRTNGVEGGAVYVMLLNADGTVKSTTKIANGLNGGPTLSSGDSFGSALASIGDWDGNGVTDLLVGAWGDDTAGPDRGSVYLVRLNSDGTALDTIKIAHELNGGPSVADNDGFGLAVGSLGDLNGDGINDLAVGAWADGAAGATGALYLLMMNAFDPSGSTDAVASTVKIASGTPSAPVLVDGDRFGRSIASLGDIDSNPNTALAIAVGSSNDQTGGFNRGAIHVLFLNASGGVESSTKIASDLNGGPTLADNDRFGISATSLGDLNGDGVTDLAVGARY